MTTIPLSRRLDQMQETFESIKGLMIIMLRRKEEAAEIDPTIANLAQRITTLEGRLEFICSEELAERVKELERKLRIAPAASDDLAGLGMPARVVRACECIDALAEGLATVEYTYFATRLKIHLENTLTTHAKS